MLCVKIYAPTPAPFPPSPPPLPLQGKDDLRQDAVMQQVFVLVNRLLRREPATCKRRLSVRTYKVSWPIFSLFSVLRLLTGSEVLKLVISHTLLILPGDPPLPALGNS